MGVELGWDGFGALVRLRKGEREGHQSHSPWTISVDRRAK